MVKKRKKSSNESIQVVLRIPKEIIEIINKKLRGDKLGNNFTSIICQITLLWMCEQKKEIFNTPPINVSLDINLNEDLKRKVKNYRNKEKVVIRPRIPLKLIKYLREQCDPIDEVKDSTIIKQILYIWLNSKGYLP